MTNFATEFPEPAQTAAVAAVAIGVLTLLIAPAAAQSETEASIRFQETLSLSSQTPDVQFEVGRSDESSSRQIWDVGAYPSQDSGDAICRSTLPREAGEDHYDYDLEHLPDERGGHIVLLDVRSSPDDGPLDPPSFQLAFYLTEREGASQFSCSLIARGEQTELDGGTTIAIEDIDGTPRLTRRDETQRLDFCGLGDDEARGYQVFSSQTGRFLPGADVDIDTDDIPAVTAQIPETSTPNPLTEDYFTWISASSDIRGAPTGAAVPRPLMLGDLDSASPWIEGADELGIGEYVTASVNTAAALRGLRIVPGHGASAQHFERYGRPTQLLLALSDGHRMVVDIPDVEFGQLDASNGVFVAFPEPLMTDCLSVMILDAEAGRDVDDGDASEHNGDPRNSVAISELSLYSTVDGDSEGQTASRIVDSIGREHFAERRDRLVRLGNLIPGPLIDAIAEQLDDADESTRARIVPLLGTLDYEQSLPVLAHHFRRASIEDADYRRTKRAMAQHGSLAVPTLLELLGDIEDDDRKRIDLVRTIGRVGTDIHLRRLVPALGGGSPMLRSERIRAISHGGVAVVPRLVSVAASNGDNETGLDALTALVFVGKRHFPDGQADIDDIDALYQVYTDSDSRSHRIRAIEALGYFAHPDGPTILGEQLLHDDPDPLIRTFAARALERYPDEEARQYLERALDDESPDVRIAAVSTLNDRDDAVEATSRVIDYAVSDRAWPQGMHNALQLLARSPDPEALDAIAGIIEDDLTARPARTGLRSLRRAERALPVERITPLLSDESAPDSVVEQLVQMLGYAEPDEATTILTDIALKQYPPFAEYSEQHAERLARLALMSLGKTRTEEAMELLLDVASDDERSVQQRSYALRGLGFFSDPDIVDALQALSSDIPDALRPRFRRTLTMIQNRLAIDDAVREIDRLIEQLDEETTDDGQAPDDSLPFQ